MSIIVFALQRQSGIAGPQSLKCLLSGPLQKSCELYLRPLTSCLSLCLCVCLCLSVSSRISVYLKEISMDFTILNVNYFPSRQSLAFPHLPCPRCSAKFQARAMQNVIYRLVPVHKRSVTSLRWIGTMIENT